MLDRVRGNDGTWRTPDSKAIYRHAHAAGALYGAMLERELTNRLGVEWLTPRTTNGSRCALPASWVCPGRDLNPYFP